MQVLDRSRSQVPTTRRIQHLALGFALALTLGACGGGDAQQSRESRPRPQLSDELDFALTALDGTELRLADALVEGPVILDFWATWCAPCKLAMPAYAAVAGRYVEQGVKLWAVSWDDPRMHDRIAPYFERAGFTFPALLDSDKKVGRGLGVMNLPTTFLIAPDGSIAWEHVGYAVGDEKELESALRAVLGLE